MPLKARTPIEFTVSSRKIALKRTICIVITTTIVLAPREESAERPFQTVEMEETCPSHLTSHNITRVYSYKCTLTISQEYTLVK